MDNTTMWKICLIALFVSMIICIIIYRSLKQRFDLFDPYYWVAAIYIMVMVFAPYTWVVQEKVTWHGFPVLVSLPTASLYFGVSFISFTLFSIGKVKSKRHYYYSTLKNSEINVVTDDQNCQFNSALYGWIVWGIGLALSVAYLHFRGRSLLMALSFGQLGVLQEASEGSFWFLNQGTRVLLAGSLIVLVYDKKYPKLAKLAYLFMSIIVLSGGQRNQLMVVVLAPIVYSYIIKCKRPKLWKVAIFIFVAILALGWIGYNRGTFRTGNGTIQNHSLEELWEGFMVNIEVFFPGYTMLETVPSKVPHQFGASYLYTFIQFIPRFLWPGKPYPPVTNLLNAMFGDLAAWGPAYCNFSEMYLDFGFPGMIIGMGIFGAVCRNFYKKTFSNNAKLTDILSFSIFLPYLFQYITRGYFSSMAVEVFFMWGPIWVLKFFQKKNLKV